MHPLLDGELIWTIRRMVFGPPRSESSCKQPGAGPRMHSLPIHMLRNSSSHTDAVFCCEEHSCHLSSRKQSLAVVHQSSHHMNDPTSLRIAKYPSTSTQQTILRQSWVVSKRLNSTWHLPQMGTPKDRPVCHRTKQKVPNVVLQKGIQHRLLLDIFFIPWTLGPLYTDQSSSSFWASLRGIPVLKICGSSPRSSVHIFDQLCVDQLYFLVEGARTDACKSCLTIIHLVDSHDLPPRVWITACGSPDGQ